MVGNFKSLRLFDIQFQQMHWILTENSRAHRKRNMNQSTRENDHEST